MSTEDIEVRENENTRGYYADFTMNGRKYYADVSRVIFCGQECMIFTYNEDGKSIDWSGVYVNRDVKVSKEALLQCIKEFMEQEGET